MSSLILKRMKEIEKRSDEKDDLILDLQARQADYEYMKENWLEMEKRAVDDERLTENANQQTSSMKSSSERLEPLNAGVDEYDEVLKSRDEALAKLQEQEQELGVLRSRMNDYEQVSRSRDEALEKNSAQDVEIVRLTKWMDDFKPFLDSAKTVEGEKTDATSARDQLEQEKAQWVEREKQWAEKEKQWREQEKIWLEKERRREQFKAQLEADKSALGLSLEQSRPTSREVSPWDGPLGGESVDDFGVAGGDALSERAETPPTRNGEALLDVNRKRDRLITASTQYSDSAPPDPKTRVGHHAPMSQSACDWRTYGDVIPVPSLATDLAVEVRNAVEELLALPAGHDPKKLLRDTMTVLDSCLHQRSGGLKSSWETSAVMQVACLASSCTIVAHSF